MTPFPFVKPIIYVQLGKMVPIKYSSVLSFHSKFPFLYISSTFLVGLWCSDLARFRQCSPPKCILDLLINFIKFLEFFASTVFKSWVTSKRSWIQSYFEYATSFLMYLKGILDCFRDSIMFYWWLSWLYFYSCASWQACKYMLTTNCSAIFDDSIIITINYNTL